MTIGGTGPTDRTIVLSLYGINNVTHEWRGSLVIITNDTGVAIDDIFA